jgi:hypothetical protein
MSIPLDRLYHFLNDVTAHALLIYGWQPHGSKKLQDLGPLFPQTSNWQIKKTQLPLIFHDQEPLDYDFSQYVVDQDFCDAINSWGWEESLWISLPLIQTLHKKMHLRSVLDQSFYDLTLLVHSEKNSHQVSLFEKNNFVPVYYWNHAILARDWFRYAEHDLLLKTKSQSPKTFLIYNRAWSGSREYRLKFAEIIINTGLDQDSIISFSCTDNNVHYQDHNFKNTNFKLDRFDLEKVLPNNVHNSAASADYNNQDYQNSMIEVVLETLFDDTRHHLTEKALRPIACKQPFILAGTPGSLTYLRDYGFKTFDGFIDETYDTIVDPLKRIYAITQEMQRISALTTDQKNQLIQNIQPIVEHNQKLFFSQQFHNSIVAEFKKNLDIGVEKIKSGSIGKNWKLIRETAIDHCPELFYKCADQTQDELDWAYSWIDSHTSS